MVESQVVTWATVDWGWVGLGKEVAGVRERGGEVAMVGWGLVVGLARAGRGTEETDWVVAKDLGRVRVVVVREGKGWVAAEREGGAGWRRG